MYQDSLPQGIVRSELRMERGVPRLYIQDEPVPVTMFCYLSRIEFYNYIKDPRTPYPSVDSQMERADRLGNRIVNVVINFSLVDTMDMRRTVDAAMNEVMTNAPHCYVFLRFGVNSNAYGIPGASPEKDHFRHHSSKYSLNMMDDSEDLVQSDIAGKTEGFCSLASIPWIEQAKKTTADLVRYIRSVPEYARRVIAYMPCAGSAGEWFGPLFFEGATDGSDANIAGFRAFLTQKYGTDEALSQAWGVDGLTLNEVTIPDEIPGSGIERIKWETELPETLILTPAYQCYADYEDYYSGMVADRIIALCEVIKEECHNETVTSVFYGYHGEVRVPFSGSFGLYKIKKSKAVDILSGPVSYKDRDLGGMGAYMAPAASICASEKLWIDEADYRTHCRSSDGIIIPSGTGQDGVGDCIPCLENEAATLEVQRRQFGKNMVDGTGVWWFDLVQRGWFDYDAFWEETTRLGKLTQWFATRRGEETPDIAIVYDEEALNVLGQPWQYGEDMLNDLRLMLFRMGYSFGQYASDDIIAGKAKDAKLCIFLTPWRLSEEKAEALKPLLAHKTVCWCYGNGLTDPATFESLTGFRLDVLPGAGPQKLVFDENTPFGGAEMCLRRLSPVYAAVNGLPLARYSESSGIAAAQTRINGYDSIFLGGTSLTGEVYQTLARMAGAHRYFDQEDVSYHNTRLAVLHAGKEGERTLRLPEPMDVYDYFAQKAYPPVQELTFHTHMGQTHYFFLGCGDIPALQD